MLELCGMLRVMRQFVMIVNHVELVVHMPVLINQLLFLNCCLKHRMQSSLVQSNFLMIDMINHLRITLHVQQGLLTCDWHENTIVNKFLRILTRVVHIELWSIILRRFLHTVSFITTTRRIRFRVIHTLITQLFGWINFGSFIKVILIKETWTFWCNYYRADMFTILVLIWVHLIIGCIVYTHLLKI